LSGRGAHSPDRWSAARYEAAATADRPDGAEGRRPSGGGSRRQHARERKRGLRGPRGARASESEARPPWGDDEAVACARAGWLTSKAEQEAAGGRAGAGAGAWSGGVLEQGE